MEFADLKCRYRPLNLACSPSKIDEISASNAPGALELLGQNTV
jgi:hypothetical protein